MCTSHYDTLSLKEALNKLKRTEKTEEEIHYLESVITRLDFFCKICDKDTLLDPKDYYMVTPEVWEKFGVGKALLCMDCLEERLGHKLTKEEILPCIITTVTNPYTREILTK